jgi:GT2 family glycosyltransferase
VGNPGKTMKLSIIIICWNDLKVIADCLESLFRDNCGEECEVIVSDNGSADGSIEFIRRNYPRVCVIENGANLGFSKGNNVGVRIAQGEYVLILNPDTIVHPGALQKWIEFAGQHPEAGAFGCRVLNPDGSYQSAPRPFPTLWREWIAALYLRPLARLSEAFVSDSYTGWNGDTERQIDWQSGCCVMFRGSLLKQLGGFDEHFFYHFEEVDLCRRVWNAGYPIVYTPAVTITHLGGQSVGRFPIRFAIERERGRYRYFHKHFGRVGARRCRYAALAWFGLRNFGYGLLHMVRPTDVLKGRLAMYKAVMAWTNHLDPVRFVEEGHEPDSDRTATAQAT